MSTFKKYMKIIQEVKDMEDKKPIHTGVDYIGLSSYFQYAGVMGYDKNDNALDEKNKNAYYADYIEYIKDNIDDFKEEIEQKNKQIKPENIYHLSITNIKTLKGVATEKDFANELKEVMKGRKSRHISRDIVNTVRYGQSLEKVNTYLNEILKNPKYKIGFFDELGASIAKLFKIGNKKDAITMLKDLAFLNYKQNRDEEYKKNVIERLFGRNENAFNNHHPSLITPNMLEERN